MSRFCEQAVRLFPLAARALGWTPDTFWAATPADLALALTEPGTAGAGLTRAEFDRLLKDHDHG